ncbi:hypothetical protein SK571_40435 [Lentzea sp. BCCO 10_0798]|uniref:HprK-related kinase B n=1 Tax=Lentzea kristufekii TaxID=3095430 RepID=A0ABU4U5E9_9PSEU|nr:hypothetical protein [Lentzea sp. BCCO 10_0798]MDX8055682.1 hypothetical protein [Lentzea sp. BCCO 10_0798]
MIAARTLGYRGTRLRVETEPGAGAELEVALSFLETHVAIEQGPADDVLATLRVAGTADARHSPETTADWEDIHVRKSASAFFTVPARRTEQAGRQYLRCTKTGSQFAFDPAARTIDVVLGSGGAMDFVELVRDLVLKDQENTGAAVLHATAAFRDGGAVLVTGAKGAGKSTILLELVEKFGYQIMSGDKTVLHEQADGEVLAAGWPDYPHLGYGTIVKYPGLREIAGIGADYCPPAAHAFAPTGKFAVDPIRFRWRFPSAPRETHVPVMAILHPAIGPGERTVVERCEQGPDELAAILAANVESAFDGAHAGWHGYVDDRRHAHTDRVGRIVSALAGVPAWTVTGPGDLDTGNFPLHTAASSR